MIGTIAGMLALTQAVNLEAQAETSLEAGLQAQAQAELGTEWGRIGNFGRTIANFSSNLGRELANDAVREASDFGNAVD